MSQYVEYWNKPEIEERSPVTPAEKGLVWWQAPTDEAKEQHDFEAKRANSLYGSVKSLENSQREAHEQNLWNARLYSNRELAAFDWGHGQHYNGSMAPVSLLGENLILSVVDTIVSVIGKNRTKVTPEPVGASFKVRLQARRLDKFLFGEFQRLDVYRQATRVLRDALIFSFGCMKVEVCDGKVSLRRVFPDDFIVDQNEVANSQAPAHVYERRCRRIEEVAAEYDVDVDHLNRDAQTSYLPYRSPGRGWVVVVEGYRKGVEGEPGRHVVATESCILLDEPWEHEWFPYVTYHFEDPVSGWYWPSTVERALPFQIRLNEINEVIRDAQDLVARPRLLVPEGSRINPADVDNLIGRLIKYTGIKPEPLEWNAVSGELYAERDHQVRSCFEQFGLAQLVAQGKLPGSARLDSSAALNEATQISDDRLADPMIRFEEFFMNLAKTLIRMMRLEGDDYETTWTSGGALGRTERIRWSEIDLDDNAYTLVLSAASVFSMTPSARRDKLERWLQLGVITTERYAAMEENPDLESELSIQSAAAEDIDRVIELLEDGDYEAPTPLQDLVNGVQRVNMAYLRLGRYRDVSVKVKENFIKWISAARAVLRMGTETPDTQGVAMDPQTGPAPGMAPIGLPPPQAPMGPPGMMPGMGPPGMAPGMPPMMGGMPPMV